MKSFRTLTSAGALTGLVMLLGVAGVASAQVVSAPAGPINVTTTQSSAGVTPGSTGTNFATIQLASNGGGTYSITSLPFTVTPSSGATTNSLSNCQLMNGGAMLNTGNNAVNTINSGATTNFTFDTPLVVTGATTTLTLTCNVASSATSGTSYAFVAGTPIMSSTSGTTSTTSTTSTTAGSGLGVIVNTIPSVPAGRQNALLAIITLDGSNSTTNASVSSLPLMITTSGMTSSELSNCSLHSAANISSSLNSGTNAVNAIQTSGTTSFNLDTPFSVPAGSGQLIELTCNVSSTAPAGSSIMISVNPAGVMATNTSNGSSITPMTSTSNGSSEPVSGTIMVTAPSMTSTGTTGTTGTSGTGVTNPVTTTTTGTPGAPNTGAGGNATEDFTLLALSALALVASGAYAFRRN